MLRLWLTLSVLLGLQAARAEAEDVVTEECKHMICFPVLNTTTYDGYKAYHVPYHFLLLTVISGMDLKTATDVALERFFDYARFNNYADTIVPISTPFGVYLLFEDGIIKPEFSFLISIPNVIQKPPVPRDPSLHIIYFPEKTAYLRTYEQDTGNYSQLADEFRKDLENDHRVIFGKGIYVIFYNKRGLFQIAISGI